MSIVEQFKVSIIVPIYNVEKYLAQCLDSIVNQSYKNLEILLIDDASTDNSRGICELYAAKDSRIKVISLIENHGQSYARNVGIELVQGDFLVFCDSDDWFESDFVKDCVNKAIEFDAELVMTSYYRFNTTSSTFYFIKPKYSNRLISIDEYLHERSINSSQEFGSPWGKLFKRELFEGEYPIRFPSGRTFEDQFVIHRLMLKSNKIYYYSGGMYCWRITENSVSTKELTDKAAQDDLDGYKQYIVDLMLAGKLTDEAIQTYKVHLENLKIRLEKSGLTSGDIYRKVMQEIYLSKGRK